MPGFYVYGRMFISCNLTYHLCVLYGDKHRSQKCATVQFKWGSCMEVLFEQEMIIFKIPLIA